MYRTVIGILVVSSVCCLTVFAQVGAKCEVDSDCILQLICDFNVCVCKPHFIKNGLYCFEEAHYGDECWFSEQCIDYREICKKQSYGGSICTCDKYHQYNLTIGQCLPKKNLTSMLDEEHNTFDIITEQAKRSFFGILLIGLFIMVVGLFCMIVACFYCCRIYITDRHLDKEVEILVIKNGKKLGPKNVGKTELERQQQLAAPTIGPLLVPGIVLI